MWKKRKHEINVVQRQWQTKITSLKRHRRVETEQVPINGNWNKKQSRNGDARKQFPSVPLTDENYFPIRASKRRDRNKFPQAGTRIGGNKL